METLLKSVNKIKELIDGEIERLKSEIMGLVEDLVDSARQDGFDEGYDKGHSDGVETGKKEAKDEFYRKEKVNFT